MNGEKLYVTAQQDRDAIAIDEARIKVHVRPEDGPAEETIVTRSALAYFRTTKREVPIERSEADLRIVS